MAFPKYDLGWLAWIALLPLLFAVYGKRALFGFFLAFLCGISFFSGVFYWTLQVSSYTFLHQIILIIYLGSYFGFFGLAFSFLSKRFTAAKAFLTAPFLWVSLEFIRSNMGFLAHPWPLLGHSQVPYPQVIQIASFSGAYGVSFLVAWVNAALAAVILFYSRPSSEKHSFKHVSVLIVIGGALITSTLWYGHGVVSKPIIGQAVRVSLVQGNIGQKEKWDPRYANSIMQTYADLTREVSRERPDLIVWPEAATPRSITMDARLYGQVKDIAAEAGTSLLVGSSHQDKVRTKGQVRFKYANSAFLISPDRHDKDKRYDKIILLPFGEYLPMKETIPWSYIGIPDPGSYVAGREFTVFEFPRYRFGVTICWETVFPDTVRQFVKNGAQFVINITNEAWFGRTAAPYHFLSSNVFRAVENRIYLVRCGNTGVSCVIDPYGRVVDRVKDAGGQDIFVRGALTERIIPMDSNTVYTRYGDWLAWLCIGCAALFLVIGLSQYKSNRFSIS
jgi:apolipoprotein N-acyltransferase